MREAKDIKRRPARYFAHPKALVDRGARIGEGTRVWAFAHVLSGAIIGRRCNICDYVFVETGATIGDDVTVKTGVSVWDGVTVENGVFLGPSCVFTNDRVPRSFLKRVKAKWLVKTHLKQGCTVGANATIVCGTTVGRFAFIAAGAVVTKDVPDFGMVAGVPARFRQWICVCGGRLGLKPGNVACGSCGEVYKITKTSVIPISDVSVTLPGRR